jgi:hypothetical protein
MNEEALIYLKETARDTRELLLHIREVVKYVKEAESEVPEKMRRFIIMYFHDMHDLRDLYHSHDSDAGGRGEFAFYLPLFGAVKCLMSILHRHGNAIRGRHERTRNKPPDLQRLRHRCRYNSAPPARPHISPWQGGGTNP